MRILVVEDEHRIADSIRKGLRQERYTVDVAYSGADGYDLASTEDYDLILLDLLLPGMDGVAICKELRKNNIHTPVLMLTAKGQTEDKILGLNAGADDYLTKPFSFEELLARIKAITRRPKKTLVSTLNVDELILDPDSFHVARNGKTIRLSHREFSLLEYLMRNPYKVLTKDQIISHVWDYEADILPNTVEVYIRNLRIKIDAPFPHLKTLIHTIRGFGYQIGTKH